MNLKDEARGMGMIKRGAGKTNAWKTKGQQSPGQDAMTQLQKLDQTNDMARFAIAMARFAILISVVALISALVATGFATIVFIDRVW